MINLETVMDENLRMWMENVFNIAYLIVICRLVIIMTWRCSYIAPKDRTAVELITWAFALLALGDTGHVGIRVTAYA